MKTPLFEFPSYRYLVSDWEFKKKGILNRINKQKYVRTKLQTFLTDRQTNNKSYVHYLAELLIPELTEFCQEAGVTCQMTDAWCVKYQKGDYQTTHNHRGWGFSGVLYVTYDHEVHTPTKFVAPWNDPRNDCTTLAYPPGITEGVLFIAPSWALHFVEPNESRKERVVIVFDLLPKLPDHQSINIDDK
tara:strand:- start:6366 stop:6929 length:564 start_codon:yes stop_codon:yes gene_type:complete